jgi:hypothetical protein
MAKMPGEPMEPHEARLVLVPFEGELLAYQMKRKAPVRKALHEPQEE